MEKTMTALLECAGKPSPKENLPACALHKEGYDLYPQIHVDGFPGQAWKGYGGLRDYLNQLRGDKERFVVVAEVYPGCRLEEILRGMGQEEFSHVFNAETAVKDSHLIAAQLHDQLTDDRAVSYTHLDVYKRQERESANGTVPQFPKSGFKRMHPEAF